VSGTRAGNGRSSIYKDDKGVWHGWVTMGRDASGKTVRRHVRGKTATHVAEKVALLEAQRNGSAGRTAVAGKTTVGEWLDEWLRIILRTRAPRTYESYESLLRVHCGPIRRIHLSKLTVNDIDDLLEQVATTSTSSRASTLHRALRACLNVAVKRSVLQANPCKYAAVPQTEEPEIEPLTIDETRRVLTAASTVRNSARWSVALALGLRQGEALGLKWADLNPQAGTLQVRRQLQRLRYRHGCEQTEYDHKPAACPMREGGGLVFRERTKSKHRRVVGVPEQLGALLREQRRAQAAERLAAGPAWVEHDLIFPQANGKPMDTRGDARAWKKILIAAGVHDARLHDARHTNATLLLAQGIDGRIVMSLLGWSQAVLLTRYQHVIDPMRQEAANRVGKAIWG
jgi:integrase